MKLLYMIYFSGMAIFILNSVSYVLFKRAKWKTKLRYIFQTGVFSVLWPLAIFSSEGRNTLLSRTLKL